MHGAYRVIRADVFVHDNKSVMARDDYFDLKYELGSESDFLYAKFENAHIPIYPESAVPSETIVVSQIDAEEYEIEEGRKEAIIIMNPEVIEWLERY